jgi:transcriptional regulator with XRE-family HTH domain
MRMRQNQLAKILRIDETMLSKILNGFREPSPQIREKIASVLQSEESWLFQVEADSIHDPTKHVE